MSAYRHLFTIRVEHEFFAASPQDGAYGFQPDPDTADWLGRRGCVMRASRNTLQILYEVAEPPINLGPGLSSRGRLTPGEAFAPVQLRFAVQAMDQAFGLYTDCVADAAVAAPATDETKRTGPAPGVIIREGKAQAPRQPSPGVAAVAPTPPEFLLDSVAGPVRPAAGGDGQPNFTLAVALSSAPADDAHAITRTVTLASRAVTWKYWLSGEWPATGLDIIDETGTTAPADPAPFERCDPTDAGDGPRVAFRSRSPIGLSARPQGRMVLRDITGVDPEVLLTLPMASAANLIREQAGDTSSLVCEIFVYA